MRVLWFCNTPALASDLINKKNLGGGWLYNLNKAIKNKVELHVVYYSKEHTDPFLYENTYYYPIFKGNLYWNFVKGFFTDNERNKSDVIVFIKLIDIIKPDIIHIHGTEKSFGCIINKTKIPTVISIQGIINLIFHNYLAGIPRKYMFTIPLKLKDFYNGLFPFYRVYKRLYKWTYSEKIMLNGCKYLLGRTEWDKNVSRVLSPKSFYFNEDRILRDVFYENTWKKKPHEKKIIIHSTSANSFYKGLETICQAASILVDLNISFEWRIAGINQDDLIVKVVKRIMKNKYPASNLYYLGTISSEELVHNLVNADLFVMASHIENNANNLCEALIIGMPCISSNVGGVGSLITNNFNGILIQDSDQWALAGNIIKIANDFEFAQKMANNARINALKKHDKERITNDILSIYNEILENEKKDCQSL